MNVNRCIRRLVWHRRDLRLHDNELYAADACETQIVSLYVIDPSDFTLQEKDTVPTTGPHACRALIGALSDLRRRLEERGGTLLIRRGDPLEIVPSMAAELGVDQVWWSEDPGFYETQLSQKLSSKLHRQGQSKGPSVRTVSGYALYHPDDLPHGDSQWSALARPNEKKKKKKPSRKAVVETDVSLPTPTCDELCSLVNLSPERLVAMPRIMGDFRRAARTATKPRPCIEVPPRPLLCAAKSDDVDAGELPTMVELTQSMKDKRLLGLPAQVINAVIADATTKEHTEFAGGETEALQRLTTFLDDGHAATAVRNLADVSGNNQSANISVYLALGSLSPRLVFHSAAAAGDCDWLVSHMTMRDFFVYSAYKQGKDLFRLSGSPVHKPKRPVVWKQPSEHMDFFVRWATGETGLPLIDAGTKEMMATGYCSNRVRQNMASVLTKDLELDWRYGAAWMQFCLSDHCVGANWGNWQYFGGVGADPKNRHFRTVSQALKYDPSGDYVKKWIPALENETSLEVILRPWDFIENWQQPVADPKTQYVWQDSQRLETFGFLFEPPPNLS